LKLPSCPGIVVRMFGPTCQRWDEWGTAWDSRLLFAGFLPCGRQI
jgi:hypothetical protein